MPGRRGPRRLKMSNTAEMAEELASMRKIPRHAGRRMRRTAQSGRLEPRHMAGLTFAREPTRRGEPDALAGKLRFMTWQKRVLGHGNIPAGPVNDR